MVLKWDRKIQESGSGAYLLTLPKEWVEGMREEGKLQDEVVVVWDGDRLVIEVKKE